MISASLTFPASSNPPDCQYIYIFSILLQQTSATRRKWVEIIYVFLIYNYGKQLTICQNSCTITIVLIFFFLHKRHSYFNMFTKVNKLLKQYRLFSQDVTAAILMSQNNETAAVLVSHANQFCGS